MLGGRTREAQRKSDADLDWCGAIGPSTPLMLLSRVFRCLYWMLTMKNSFKRNSSSAISNLHALKGPQGFTAGYTVVCVKRELVQIHVVLDQIKITLKT
ncbi:hypothetical protein GWI33_020562 [Rhynchophorus ferrugineus]|uniref:Uncharacterized protein n=1 Tax=Rhynchophorus ferrugineus TaxID=354439 RepID=A0A834I339_RHYFE|nr:hypothetical protein GWI33_020562 [Rhynchophorus ferrugineus]